MHRRIRSYCSSYPYSCALLIAATLLPGCIIITGDDDGTNSHGSHSNSHDDASDSYDSGYDSSSESDSGYTGYDSGIDTNDTSIEPTGADNDPEAECPCAPGTDLIYVLSDIGEIWSFDPKDVHFERIAAVQCGNFSSTFSMGVSRKARAWVQYQHGDLYTVDLNDPGDPITCLDPGFEHGHPKFPNFGMAFVANSVFDTCDKLYAHTAIGPGVIGPDSGALGVIDPYTLELTEVASIDYGWGELTGTSTGRLFAYQGTAPPILSEYDKETGELLDSLPLPELSSDSAFAFAWWGGDFYLFHDPNNLGESSDVWHLDYDSDEQTMTKILSPAPIRIVGAGVSTCVPAGPV